jgi:hypothetical protein
VQDKSRWNHRATQPVSQSTKQPRTTCRWLPGPARCRPTNQWYKLGKEGCPRINGSDHLRDVNFFFF